MAVVLAVGIVGPLAVASGQDAPHPGATIPVAVRDPEAGHPDVATKKEHCAVAAATLKAIGSAVGSQVRVRRGADDFAVFTVVGTLDAPPDAVAVVVSKLGRERLRREGTGSE